MLGTLFTQQTTNLFTLWIDPTPLYNQVSIDTIISSPLPASIIFSHPLFFFQNILTYPEYIFTYSFHNFLKIMKLICKNIVKSATMADFKIEIIHLPNPDLHPQLTYSTQKTLINFYQYSFTQAYIQVRKKIKKKIQVSHHGRP